MQFEEKVVIKASPERIFSVYENVSGWSSWDPDVLFSSIDGAFEAGVRGKLKPKKGPAIKITLTEVTKNKSFTTENKLPLCTVSFKHELTSLGDTTEVVHKVVFSGLLSPVYGVLIGIGTGMKKVLPLTMQGLKGAAEAKKV